MPDIPRQQLAYILTQFGRSICDDPKRCEALLKDLCPNHKREVNLLLAALREGVVKDLLNASPLVPIESSINRLTSKMHDNLGTAEHLAQWAVESWALVLGFQLKSSVISPSPDNSKVGIGLPKNAAPIKPINQLSQAVINQFKGWQKIGLNGEKLAVDSPHWAAVIDEKNNLMWAINPSKNADFPNPYKMVVIEDAFKIVKSVCNQSWCGYADWRLPTIVELKTLLLTNTDKDLHICKDIFTDVDGDYYVTWCLPPFVDVDDIRNWDGDFFVNFGGELEYFDHLYVNHVRLVRSC